MMIDDDVRRLEALQDARRSLECAQGALAFGLDTEEGQRFQQILHEMIRYIDAALTRCIPIGDAPVPADGDREILQAGSPVGEAPIL